MSLICNNCRTVFEYPKNVVDKHGLDTPPYEEYLGCPECESPDYDEAVECFRCGETIGFEEAREDGDQLYCENCYDEMFG